MILIGELALWVALLMAAWSVITSFAGGLLRRPELVMSGERAIYAMSALLLAALAGLATALVTHDFSFRYVAHFTSANLPTLYAFSALWAARAGTLLVWALLVATCAALAVFMNRKRHQESMPYATGTLASVLLILLAASCLQARPYDRLDWVSPEGMGLDPLWQNPFMAAYPPILYLGFAAATVPFAFAIAALTTRRLERESIISARGWALASWIFLTAGILLGMRWAYVEPTWNDLWEWNAVLNGSLLVWSCTTVFLHLSSVDERRGMLRKWNLTLLISNFLLVALCTLIKLGGVMDTVRTFRQSGNADWFLVVLSGLFVTAAYQVSHRLDDVESVAGERHGTASGLGRALVSSGIALLLVAFVGLAFRTTHSASLKAGESLILRDPFGATWKFTSQGVSQFAALNRTVTAVALQTTRNDRTSGLIMSEHRQHADSRGTTIFRPSKEPGIAQSWKQDVYVVLDSVEEDETATLLIAFNPLVAWIWVGGAVLMMGGILLFWPRSHTQNA